jgi:hypothetical protein
MTAAKPTIFIFCRPYLVEEFRANFAPLNGEFTFKFMTDGKCSGTSDTRHDFYKNMAAGTRCEELSGDEIEDVRDRCRLLREIDRDKSLAMIHAMALCLAQQLDGVKPDVIVSHLIDEYILHLLSILAAHRGIKTIAYCGSYFSGRALVVSDSLGSPLNARTVSDEEVASSLEAISPATFRQNYRQITNYSFSKHVKLVLKYWTKPLYYKIKGFLERDRMNMHYMMVPYWGDRRYFSYFPHAAEFENWSDVRNTLASKVDGPVIYIPLSYIPEATTNYWICNRKAINYEEKTIDIARELGASGLTVLIKEHAHMMGIRNPNFYRNLRKLGNIKLIHPEENSNAILADADAMLIGSGSGGVEATIRDKPVLTYCDTSYWFKPSGATFLDLDKISTWPALIRATLELYVPKSKDQKFEFIRQCLQSTVRSRPGTGIFPFMQVDDMRGILLKALASRVKV